MDEWLGVLTKDNGDGGTIEVLVATRGTRFWFPVYGLSRPGRFYEGVSIPVVEYTDDIENDIESKRKEG